MSGISKTEKERRTKAALDKINIQTEISVTRDFLRVLAKHLVDHEMDGQAGNCTLRADGLTKALYLLDAINP